MGEVKFAETVFSSGDEISFITNVATYITNLDSRITCLTDIDAEFDNSDLTHTPVINFLIDGQLSFTLTRTGNLNTSVYDYSSNCKGVVVRIQFAGDARRPWDIYTRRYKISSIINDELILISINGCYSNGGAANNNLNIVYTKQSDITYYSVVSNLTFGLANIFNISSRPFYADTPGGGVSGIFASRFSYSSIPGYIDYVKSAVYVDNGLKKFALNCIYDCTTVTVGDSVSLDSGRYYAVGPHQLVKIENL
jgi:hypothetical protein